MVSWYLTNITAAPEREFRQVPKLTWLLQGLSGIAQGLVEWPLGPVGPQMLFLPCRGDHRHPQSRGIAAVVGTQPPVRHFSHSRSKCLDRRGDPWDSSWNTPACSLHPCCPLAAGPGAARMPQSPWRCLSLSSLITVSVKTAVLSTIMYR